MIAREERPRLGVMQTNMVRRMPGRVLDEPFTAGEFDDVTMFDVMRHGRHEFASADGCGRKPARAVPKIGTFLRPFPGSRCRDSLQGAKDIAQRILRAPAIALEEFHVDRQIVDGCFGVMVFASVHMRMSTPMPHFLGARVSLAPSRRAPEMESTVGDDLGAGFFVDAHGAPEMVRVRMRNEHRVNMPGLKVRLLQAMHDGIPGAGARQARIDDGDAVPIDHGIHIHMSEAGDANRQLHAKDILGDLSDAFLRVFLFLSFRLAHYTRL